MFVNKLVHILSTNSDTLAQIWLRKVRKAEPLKTYNSYTDDTLKAMNSNLYRTLSQWFEKEIDTSTIGAFFVDLGKKRRAEGFSISEISYALLLSQRSVLEFLMNENSMDSSIALYTVMELTNLVADFFFLGSYYMIKGFLEDTYLALNRDEDMSEDILKKYFSDDFFFKNIGKNT